MTYEQMLTAMTAVQLAIRKRLMHKQEVTYATVFEYAQQYGKQVCSVEHIQAAMAIMNFELINNLITEISGAERLAAQACLKT